MMLEKIFRTRFNLVDVVAISVSNALWFNDQGLAIAIFIGGTLISVVGRAVHEAFHAKK